MPGELHLTAAARLRRDGQRYTANRRALVEVLDHAASPLTIPEILQRQGAIPQSSAYRNLGVLERSGVVRRVVTSDEFARFELAEDLTEHHHHLICSSCGTVADFTVSRQLERSLTAALARVASRTGFRTEHHRLDLVCTCSTCS